MTTRQNGPDRRATGAIERLESLARAGVRQLAKPRRKRRRLSRPRKTPNNHRRR